MRAEVVPIDRARRAAAGEPSTLDELYREKGRYVATIAFRMLGRDADVDDVVQEVFMLAVRAREKLDPSLSITGWLATVTVRVCGKKLRRRRLRRTLGMDEDTSYDHVASADADAPTRILLARVYKALDRLDVEDRLAWTLRYLEGEALDVVATRCECSLATAKRRIARAHLAIQKETGDG